MITELIGVLTGNLTVENGGNVVAPAIIMAVLLGGGGLFLILFRSNKDKQEQT